MISFISRGLSTSFRVATYGFNSLCSTISALYLRIFSRNNNELMEVLNTHQEEITATVRGNQQKAARLGKQVDQGLQRVENKNKDDLEKVISRIEGQCHKIESATARFLEKSPSTDEQVEELLASYKRPDLKALAAKLPELPTFKPYS